MKHSAPLGSEVICYPLFSWEKKIVISHCILQTEQLAWLAFRKVTSSFS